jgi:hypothetical protein
MRLVLQDVERSRAGVISLHGASGDVMCRLDLTEDASTDATHIALLGNATRNVCDIMLTEEVTSAHRAHAGTVPSRFDMSGIIELSIRNTGPSEAKGEPTKAMAAVSNTV